jgi:hypothetical protein
MNGVVVRRWLKVADPTAVTARETLQRALGRGREVTEVHRSEVTALTWGGNPPGAFGEVETLTGSTNLLLNPNKHFHEIVEGKGGFHLRGNAWVMVSDPDQGSALGSTLARRRLLPFSLERVRSATLWELTLEGDEATRPAKVREIAVSRRRDTGLLGNPHSEDIVVFDTAPDAARLIRSLMTTEGISLHGS